MLNIPNKCPVCESTLDRVNDQLFCKNSSCSAKSSKQLLHFVKTMKIKGMGEKTLEKLDLDGIVDIYALTQDELITKLGEKIGTKLFNEITNSKHIDLDVYITSFGISLIGGSASKKLITVIKSLWDVTAELSKKAGLGEKATSNLLQWVKENKEMYIDLPITFKEVNGEPQLETLLNVVITGKLEDFPSRAKAKNHLESLGIKVLGSLSSKANYLVCDQEDSKSSSFKKAETMNIPVVTMKNLLNIIKET